MIISSRMIQFREHTRPYKTYQILNIIDTNQFKILTFDCLAKKCDFAPFANRDPMHKIEAVTNAVLRCHSCHTTFTTKICYDRGRNDRSGKSEVDPGPRRKSGETLASKNDGNSYEFHSIFLVISTLNFSPCRDHLDVMKRARPAFVTGDIKHRGFANERSELAKKLKCDFLYHMNNNPP